jgi:hypothetical protein
MVPAGTQAFFCFLGIFCSRGPEFYGKLKIVGNSFQKTAHNGTV